MVFLSTLQGLILLHLWRYGLATQHICCARQHQARLDQGLSSLPLPRIMVCSDLIRLEVAA